MSSTHFPTICKSSEAYSGFLGELDDHIFTVISNTCVNSSSVYNESWVWFGLWLLVSPSSPYSRLIPEWLILLNIFYMLLCHLYIHFGKVSVSSCILLFYIWLLSSHQKQKTQAGVFYTWWYAKSLTLFQKCWQHITCVYPHDHIPDWELWLTATFYHMVEHYTTYH